MFAESRQPAKAPAIEQTSVATPPPLVMRLTTKTGWGRSQTRMQLKDLDELHFQEGGAEEEKDGRGGGRAGEIQGEEEEE